MPGENIRPVFPKMPDNFPQIDSMDFWDGMMDLSEAMGSDAELKQAFEDDPARVMAEHGVDATVELENGRTSKVTELMGKMSAAELSAVASSLGDVAFIPEQIINPGFAFGVGVIVTLFVGVGLTVAVLKNVVETLDYVTSFIKDIIDAIFENLIYQAGGGRGGGPRHGGTPPGQDEGGGFWDWVKGIFGGGEGGDDEGGGFWDTVTGFFGGDDDDDDPEVGGGDDETGRAIDPGDGDPSFGGDDTGNTPGDGSGNLHFPPSGGGTPTVIGGGDPSITNPGKNPGGSGGVKPGFTPNGSNGGQSTPPVIGGGDPSITNPGKNPGGGQPSLPGVPSPGGGQPGFPGVPGVPAPGGQHGFPNRPGVPTPGGSQSGVPAPSGVPTPGGAHPSMPGVPGPSGVPTPGGAHDAMPNAPVFTPGGKGEGLLPNVPGPGNHDIPGQNNVPNDFTPGNLPGSLPSIEPRPDIPNFDPIVPPIVDIKPDIENKPDFEAPELKPDEGGKQMAPDQGDSSGDGEGAAPIKRRSKPIRRTGRILPILIGAGVAGLIIGGIFLGSRLPGIRREPQPDLPVVGGVEDPGQSDTQLPEGVGPAYDPDAPKPSPEAGGTQDPDALKPSDETGAMPGDKTEPCAHKDRTAQTVEATCKEDGYTVEFCSTCKEELSKTVIEATGHNWKVREEKQGDCENEGYIRYACNWCASEKKEPTSLGDHVLYVFSESEGTCTSEGQIQYACEVCGKIIKVESTGGGGHQWEIQAENEATCYSPASTIRYCPICETEEEIEYGSIGDHRYVDGYCEYCLEPELKEITPSGPIN